MEFVSNENILKLLFSYNPWWQTGFVQKEFIKEMKRFAYYDAIKTMLNKSIRRSVILCGARRTGKTTIMYQTIDTLIKNKVPPKNIIFISFDHPLLKLYSIDKVIEIYHSNISADSEFYCFFDEIQYASDWNKWLKILYDTNPNIRIMATGSASPILRDKASESGLGRWTIIHVPTLSFYEYCQLLNITVPELPQDIKPTQLYQRTRQEQTEIFNKLSSLQIHFLRYLNVGGFPELALSHDDIYAQRILREDIVDKALKRDLPAIYGIRSIIDIEKLFFYLCYTSSNIVNIAAISKELDGVTRNTIDKYIEYLESANLIYVSPSINTSPKQVLKSQKKIYIADAAIRNAVLLKDDITNDPDELGIIAETAVYKHIKSFYYNENVEIGYFRESKKGKEIDIIVKSIRFQSILIEVKYREQSKITDNDAIVTEGSDKFPGIVITKRADDFGEFKYGDKSIYKIPAPAFLYLLGHVEYQRAK